MHDTFIAASFFANNSVTDSISCLCITRANRLTFLRLAIGDFVRQTHPLRELIILHDGDTADDQLLSDLAAPVANARVVKASAGLSLGELRNLSVAEATGDWVCQWDDDDRYHPERLALQLASAQATGAAYNYLQDQLHWFSESGRLCWDDWAIEAYPFNLIHGSLLARREHMPTYPSLARGEDSAHTASVFRLAHSRGLQVSRLSDKGWCYVYTFHGSNTWQAAHHEAISALKHLPAERLLPRLSNLDQRLGEYDPPLPAVQMRVGQGQWHWPLTT
jgi:glycosyltransferase involved in cell wall biosynthesis